MLTAFLHDYVNDSNSLTKNVALDTCRVCSTISISWGSQKFSAARNMSKRQGECTTLEHFCLLQFYLCIRNYSYRKREVFSSGFSDPRIIFEL